MSVNQPLVDYAVQFPIQTFYYAMTHFPCHPIVMMTMITWHPLPPLLGLPDEFHCILEAYPKLFSLIGAKIYQSLNLSCWDADWLWKRRLWIFDVRMTKPYSFRIWQNPKNVLSHVFSTLQKLFIHNQIT